MSLESEQGSNVTFVLGGARSGKSKFAEDLVLKTGLKPIYLATGRALDDEMSERIAIHQERRGVEWETVEEPLALVDALQSNACSGQVILVDCLSLWVTNLMMAKADVAKESAALVALLGEIKVPVVLVSNEVGMGIIPDNAMARRYMDWAGDVNQRVAHAALEVYFVVSGMPLKMK